MTEAEAIDRAANHMCAWLRENVSEAVCVELDDLHPDVWREAAEVAIRAGRWEQDCRPFTTSPHRLSTERGSPGASPRKELDQ